MRRSSLINRHPTHTKNVSQNQTLGIRAVSPRSLRTTIYDVCLTRSHFQTRLQSSRTRTRLYRRCFLHKPTRMTVLRTNTAYQGLLLGHRSAYVTLFTRVRYGQQRSSSPRLHLCRQRRSHCKVKRNASHRRQLRDDRSEQLIVCVAIQPRLTSCIVTLPTYEGLRLWGRCKAGTNL